MREVTSSRTSFLNNVLLVFWRFFHGIEIFSPLNTSLCLIFSVYKMRTAIQTHKDAEGTKKYQGQEKNAYMDMCVSDYKCNIYIYI